jgi:hypothetical protein
MSLHGRHESWASYIVYFMTSIAAMYMYTRDACSVVFGAELAM